MMDKYVKPIAKFLAAVVIPALALIVTFITGDEGFGDLTTTEWILVASAAITAFAVWAIPNTPVE